MTFPLIIKIACISTTPIEYSLSELLPIVHATSKCISNVPQFFVSRYFASLFFFSSFFLIHFSATSAIFPPIHPISRNCGKCQARITARDVADANVLTPRSNCENSRIDSTLDTDTRNYFVQ